jgi:large subunit ribosomal protein L15
MQLHELKSPPGSRPRRQRVGRGTGSGRGKTSGRGQKGQNARSEGFRLGFEGGQMPLAQRLPKLPGFKNPFKKVYAVVNVAKLNRFDAGSTIDAGVLAGAGLVREGLEVKVLGTGSVDRKLTVEAHAFSNSARTAIEQSGGTVKVLGEPRKRGPKRSRKSTEPAVAAQDEDGGSTPSQE